MAQPEQYLNYLTIQRLQYLIKESNLYDVKTCHVYRNKTGKKQIEFHDVTSIRLITFSTGHYGITITDRSGVWVLDSLKDLPYLKEVRCNKGRLISLCEFTDIKN